MRRRIHVDQDGCCPHDNMRRRIHACHVSYEEEDTW
jgi:hypothetical protein